MLPSGTLPEIARWWRRQQIAKKTTTAIAAANPSYSSRTDGMRVQSTNPNSLLLRVTRTTEGVEFVRRRVRALRGELRLGDEPRLRVQLALYLEKLGEGQLEAALQEMDDALRSMSRASRSVGLSGNRSALGNDAAFHAWARSERARLAKARESLIVRWEALRASRQASSSLACSLPAGADERDRAAGKKRRRQSCSPEARTLESDVPLLSEYCVRSPNGKRESCGETYTASPSSPETEEPVTDETSKNWSSGSPSVSSATCCRFRAVDERDALTLSYQEFIEGYARPGVPVILKGGVTLCFEGEGAWGRECLLEAAGDKMVPVRRRVPDSVSWARLEDAGHRPLRWVLGEAELKAKSGGGCAPEPGVGSIGDDASGQASGACRSVIAKDKSSDGSDGVSCLRSPARSGDREGDGAEERGGGSVSRKLLYLHDWSLPQNLGVDSALLEGSFKVPRFFAGDMLQRVAGRGLPYTDSWPSLFVGPRRSMSDMHVDSFGSHFWMALLEGKKRWILYPREETPLLYPIWSEGCHDPVFDADVDAPDKERHPAALLATGFECILEAGDLIFVPAGSPHRVENLTDTLAISCNYVDATNVEGALAVLDDQALVDHGAGALASALRSCKRSLCRQQGEVSWANLKRFPRDGEVADWELDATP